MSKNLARKSLTEKFGKYMWTGKTPAEDMASLTVLEKHRKAMSQGKHEQTTHVVHAWYSMRLKILTSSNHYSNTCKLVQTSMDWKTNVEA